MAIIRLQGEKERLQGIYYEFDSSSTPLGEGGMGKVYCGKRINIHTREKRDVAIKFMFSGLPANVIQRAENEANIRIQHDNLIEMMGFLTIEERMPNGGHAQRYHVVSELLTGVSLSDLLQGVVTDRNGKTIPYAQQLYKMYNTYPEKFAVTVIKKILSGIMALHDAGYIHRDIDPSNIMITNDGKIKLIDFGIAKKVDGLKSFDRNLTTAGQFMGKPQYAAPELIIGDIKHQNKPTDIYAIGVLLFQLIVGHLPFEGPTHVVLNAHMREKFPLKRVKNRGLRSIIERATEKDYTKRYTSSAEFRAALDMWSSGNTEKPKTLAIVAVAAGAVLSIMFVVAMIMLFPRKSTEPDPQPVIHYEHTETLNDIRKQLLNPSEAKEAFAKLQQRADDGDCDAMFIMSRLYAVSSGSFTLADDYVTMQTNLSSVMSQNPVEAHRLLTEIIKKDEKHYRALYELACNYYEGVALTGGEQRNLRYAKTLLDRAYKSAEEVDDRVYLDKIRALLRKY